mmetsp:Transcript_103884/g.289401  ORF Transcript_103884/g.289401 Transcript_103884/m.289401 type:complete len:120 (+) Transcript_103884:417-776(+)
MTPSAATRMRSQSWTVDKRCAMATDVRPTLAASSAACTTFSLSESNALVASSNSKTGGSRTNARQMAMRCFCPPDKRPPRAPTIVCQPSPPSSLSRKSRCAICRQVSRRSFVIVNSSTP